MRRQLSHPCLWFDLLWVPPLVIKELDKLVNLNSILKASVTTCFNFEDVFWDCQSEMDSQWFPNTVGTYKTSGTSLFLCSSSFVLCSSSSSSYVSVPSSSSSCSFVSSSSSPSSSSSSLSSSSSFRWKFEMRCRRSHPRSLFDLSRRLHQGARWNVEFERLPEGFCNELLKTVFRDRWSEMNLQWHLRIIGAFTRQFL
jgi:hypothetical protein